ncbi:RHS repeat-associated core domain-containing protein [Streptomyces sp. SBC-4]|nr:RHS repeat-associated core domain-containing protein [Streptomyces sp. SBC-4]MDV5143139.1 RHS repeat-associated core domain-containing protein [Streptomyces sp. SBC-4]
MVTAVDSAAEAARASTSSPRAITRRSNSISAASNTSASRATSSPNPPPARGQPTPAPRTGQPAVRYNWLGGKQRSAETLSGLVLMGVRLCNPQTGRSLSMDPVYGGNANAYDYVSGDPLNRYDLDGEAPPPRPAGRCWQAGFSPSTGCDGCSASGASGPSQLVATHDKYPRKVAGSWRFQRGPSGCRRALSGFGALPPEHGAHHLLVVPRRWRGPQGGNSTAELIGRPSGRQQHGLFLLQCAC